MRVCVCIPALVSSHANRMRRVIQSSVVIWLCHIFPHHLINDTIFGEEKKLLNTNYILIFSTTLA
jgi:hypothetical protein